MKFAVTGASGFIGRQLADRLAGAGHSVRILSRAPIDRPGFEGFRGTLGVDAADTFIPFVSGVDVVLHCAGETRDEGRMEQTHVRGTRDLLLAAKGRIGHWVQLSSLGAYGARRSGIVREDTQEQPQGVYEETKAISDGLVLESAAAGDFTAAVLRPSIVIGPDMANNSIRQLAALVRRGVFAHIGAPGASANYVHVDDVVAALIFLATKSPPPSGIFNLSSWSTMEAFVAALAQAQGRRPPKLRIPEAAARLIARAGAPIANFPMTEARVDALTSRARYDASKLESLGFTLQYRADEAAMQIAKHW